jgi:hypothetical protein
LVSFGSLLGGETVRERARLQLLSRGGGNRKLSRRGPAPPTAGSVACPSGRGSLPSAFFFRDSTYLCYSDRVPFFPVVYSLGNARSNTPP